MLIRNVRLVPVGGRPAPDAPVDLELDGERIAAIRPAGASGGGGMTQAGSTAGEVVDAGGRWAIPGLWDHHVHFAQWGLETSRLDMRGTTSAAEACARVAERLASGKPLPATGVLVGTGHRSVLWPDAQTVAVLDAACGETPVVLISGDGHHGWLSSAALRLFGVPPRDGVMVEDEWYAVYDRLTRLPGAEKELAAGYRGALDAAAAMGVVGIVDFEFGDGFRTWNGRIGAGLDSLRVRAAVYPEFLDDVIAVGLRAGDPLPGAAELPAAVRSLAVMGPLKVITDGSLNTRTAWCSAPYADPVASYPRGIQNMPAETMVALLRRVKAAGLNAALHAIGDAAIDDVLNAFEASGARGSVEHAQLTRPDQLARFPQLGIAASIQPAHLLDDRDVSEQCWPDRTAWCFPLRGYLTAGAELRMGSDAPVSPLDPWLAMAAAVHRSADARPAWHGEEALTASEALDASTDGRKTLAAGEIADLVLLDGDAPFGDRGMDPAAVADRLRGMRAALTLVGGRVTHRAL